MSKSKSSDKAAKGGKKATVAAENPKVDPVLSTLFASSSGPVSAPVRNRSAAATTRSNVNKQDNNQTTSDNEDEDEGEGIETQSVSDGASSDSDAQAAEQEQEQRPRKRRRLSQEDDLETSYLNKLAREEKKEDEMRMKQDSDQLGNVQQEEDNDDDTASSASNDLEDLSDLEPESAIPKHESLSQSTAEYDKTRRTVFLGNVSTEAIKSKSSRKLLETHLKSALDTSAKESIESIRFRSTPFDVTAGPRKAAYAKKELMDETTKCTNAYVVLSSETAARRIAKTLNGTVVLERHLHTDWLAHPTAIDHKRCVFVGNLNFVDLESNVETNGEGEREKRRPRAKEPADAEEGLWRAFSKCGPVESVRVIRDKATRIGKGFAYVQFSDEVGAEKALALDGKKFPPMLPRVLRVSRAKKVLKKDLKRKREENDEARGRKTGGQRKGGPPGAGGRGKLNQVVFEGYRASSDRGMKFKSKGKKKGGVKPATRSSRRGTSFKASGGKKKRDSK